MFAIIDRIMETVLAGTLDREARARLVVDAGALDDRDRDVDRRLRLSRHRRSARGRLHVEAASRHDRATKAVSIVDVINVFTDSPAERAAKDAKAQMQQASVAFDEARVQLNVLFDRALLVHREPRLVVQFHEVIQVILSISAVATGRRSGSTEYTLRGVSDAARSVTQWIHELEGAVGAVPSVSFVVERWARARLA